MTWRTCTLVGILAIALVAPVAYGSDEIKSEIHSNEHSKQISKKEQGVVNSMLVASSKYSIPLPPEKLVYLKSIFPAILRVVSGERSLAEEEALFGDGVDHWPKNPAPPTLRYYKNIPHSGFSISFEKKGGNEFWAKANLAVLPSGYPHTVFRMDLKKDFFSELVFESVRAEVQEYKPIKNVVVFTFKTKNFRNNLKLKFIVRENMVDIKNDQYPSSFHALDVSRID